MNYLSASFVSVFALSIISSPSTRAGDWTYFTGPNLNGASTESGWSHQWPDGEPSVAWKREVGTGASSFVVKGNRVLTSGADKESETIVCLDLDTGKPLWEHRFPCKFSKRSFEGGTAATPTIDGEFVYNLSYDGQLQCLRLSDGEVVWAKHLIKDYGGDSAYWKYATSPLVIGDKLILDNGGSRNSTLALDKKTGRKVWGAGSGNPGYSTPTPVSASGKPAVVMFKGKALVCHDLEDGSVFWESKWKTSWNVNASSPIALPGNRLLVTSGYKRGRAVLFDISSTEPRQIWRNDDIKTKMSSAVVHGGHVFAVCGDNSGKLVCASLSDGKTRWEQKGFGFGTLTLAGDRLIVLGEKGNLAIATATGDGWTPLAEAQVLPSRCWVRPVLSHGRLLCKNNSGRVVCFDLR